MTRPCRETEEWLGRSPALLNEAQRLALEQHLSECADCRGMHTMSRALAHHAGETLGSAARERAITAALASKPRSEPRRAWLGRALAAVAALALITYAATRRKDDGWLEGAGTHNFAHATVTLSAEARVRFEAATSTLSLARGALEVEVDPAPHAPFAVETANFRALVLGTSFHVDSEQVVVRHGHVRVTRGDRQLADLHAGERYDARPRAQAPLVTPPLVAEAVPPEQVATEPSTPRKTKVEHRRAADRVEPTAAEPSARELLAQARSALARDAFDETRALLQSAEAHARGAEERAEAGTLRAELALRRRDQPAAIVAYLAVADRYPGLASGENALFAAAQLSAPQAARALWERYLARYPQGRFATQVRTRLGAR